MIKLYSYQIHLLFGETNLQLFHTWQLLKTLNICSVLSQGFEMLNPCSINTGLM